MKRIPDNRRVMKVSVHVHVCGVCVCMGAHGTAKLVVSDDLVFVRIT